MATITGIHHLPGLPHKLSKSALWSICHSFVLTSNPDYFLLLIFPPNKTLIEYNKFRNFSGDRNCHFFHYKSKRCTITIQTLQQSRVGSNGVKQLKNASYPLSIVSIISTLNFLHSLAGHSHVSCIFYSSI